MKKLALLVALALVVSVGGVYATWIYSSAAVSTVNHGFKNLSITDVDTNTTSGTVSVTDTLILKIDDNSGNHVPAWDADVTETNGGSLDILFTANSGAPKTTLQYTITVARNTYTPDGGSALPIFVTKDGTTINAAHTDAKAIITGTIVYDPETNDTGKVTESISLADITNILDLNSNIQLPLQDDYTAFRNALLGDGTNPGVAFSLIVEEI